MKLIANGKNGHKLHSVILFNPYIKSSFFHLGKSFVDFDISAVTHRVYNFYSKANELLCLSKKWKHQKIGGNWRIEDIPLKNVNIQCYSTSSQKIKTNTELLPTDFSHKLKRIAFVSSLIKAIDLVDSKYLINIDLSCIFAAQDIYLMINRQIKIPTKDDLAANSLMNLSHTFAEGIFGSEWTWLYSFNNLSTREAMIDMLRTLNAQNVMEWAESFGTFNSLPDDNPVIKKIVGKSNNAMNLLQKSRIYKNRDVYIELCLPEIKLAQAFCRDYSGLVKLYNDLVSARSGFTVKALEAAVTHLPGSINVLHWMWKKSVNPDASNVYTATTIEDYLIEKVFELLEEKGFGSNLIQVFKEEIKQLYKIDPKKIKNAKLVFATFREDVAKKLGISGIKDPELENIVTVLNWLGNSNIGPLIMGISDGFKELFKLAKKEGKLYLRHSEKNRLRKMKELNSMIGQQVRLAKPDVEKLEKEFLSKSVDSKTQKYFDLLIGILKKQVADGSLILGDLSLDDVLSQLKAIPGMQIPKSGIVASGGGYRAMLATAGYTGALESLGLLGMVDYFSALSGSSWFLFPFIAYPNTGMDVNTYNSSVLYKNFARLDKPLTNSEKMVLFSYLSKKSLANLRSVDFYGMLFGRALLHSNEPTNIFGLKRYLSELSMRTFVPIATSIYDYSQQKGVGTAAGGLDKKYECFEFSPLAAGSYDLDAWINPKYLNCRIDKATGVLSGVVPEDVLGYFMGIWGSAYTADLQLLEKGLLEIAPPKIHNFIKQRVIPFVAQLFQVVENVFLPKDQKRKIDLSKGRLSPGCVTNFSSFGTDDYSRQKIDLYDAGIDFNLAFPPLLNRGVNLYFVCDSSILYSEFLLAEKYAHNNGFKFPNISNIKDVSVFINPGEIDCPVIVYFHNAVLHSTLKFKYTTYDFAEIFQSMSSSVTKNANMLKNSVVLAFINKILASGAEVPSSLGMILNSCRNNLLKELVPAEPVIAAPIDAGAALDKK